ncbi:ParB N-terminal domain-containing protein [Staphylococcus equorum]|uniref:ParB N-terminal domain-containing protein n=1 Tax=Staphylococcus equorum TaxID=246432 RepID=UPI00255542AC|nr:ParB N-terminal domain-containing protein [Staphylococcus equorum]MDK9843646.1 ParB N-terminal domain-containing protein [Staphylococcus equorum]
MQEIIKVDISKLKFDNDINSLVPEMIEEEFNDLVNSIDEEGQRTPIHINNDNTVLDGRHRVRALKELRRNENISY